MIDYYICIKIYIEGLVFIFIVGYEIEIYYFFIGFFIIYYFYYSYYFGWWVDLNFIFEGIGFFVILRLLSYCGVLFVFIVGYGI